MDGVLGFIVFFCDVAVPVLQLLVLCAILYYVRDSAPSVQDWHTIDEAFMPKLEKRAKHSSKH